MRIIWRTNQYTILAICNWVNLEHINQNRSSHYTKNIKEREKRETNYIAVLRWSLPFSLLRLDRVDSWKQSLSRLAPPQCKWKKRTKNIKWYATRDTWHVTCDTWHVTRDMLWGWTFSQNLSYLAHTVWERQYFEYIWQTMTDSVN